MTGRRLLVALSLLQLAACTASPPAHDDFGGPPVTPSPFPRLANCTPPEGYTIPPCPGPYCAANAVGAPDGMTVDLTICFALDLVFTDGSMVAPKVPDNCTEPSCVSPALRITLGQLAGITRVEASAEGQSFVPIGYIVADPANAPLIEPSCLAALDGLTALLKLNVCSAISEVKYLRLSPDDRSPGRATIDAAEALSWRPI